jgi:hypothetical protein
VSEFIYNAEGLVQGFRLGNYLYDLGGRAVGRVSAERVYRLDGAYVGEMFRNMVVEKPVGPRPSLPPVDDPADVEPPSVDTSRGAGSQGFPDIFHRLLE